MSSSTKKRLIFFLISIITFLIIGKFIYESLKSNVVYFFSPSELKIISETPNGTIRIGGLVKPNTLKENKKELTYNFIVTDLNNDIYVEYKGLLPNLFQEGKGVVVEGKLQDKKFLLSKKILAKHDENYMPPEVAEALKKSGKWNKKYD